MEFLISNLRDRPHFRTEVADRIWRAWWRDKGTALDHIAGRVEENLRSPGIPFALVAHRDDEFLGTASVISDDMEERPQYAPWVAAAWVDADHRRYGVGSALVAAAADAAFALQFSRIFLCATPENSSFYERAGWQRLEEDVAGLNVFSMSREA